MFYYIVEFKQYFEHVKTLRFEDRPDYDYLKRLFRELFFRQGFSYDNVFDWVLLASKSLMKLDSQTDLSFDENGDNDNIEANNIHRHANSSMDNERGEFRDNLDKAEQSILNDCNNDSQDLGNVDEKLQDSGSFADFDSR